MWRSRAAMFRVIKKKEGRFWSSGNKQLSDFAPSRTFRKLLFAFSERNGPTCVREASSSKSFKNNVRFFNSFQKGSFMEKWKHTLNRLRPCSSGNLQWLHLLYLLYFETPSSNFLGETSQPHYSNIWIWKFTKKRVKGRVSTFRKIWTTSKNMYCYPETPSSNVFW